MHVTARRAVFVLVSWACTATGAALAQPIVFLGDKDLAPYEFIDNGVAKGANVDLAMAIGRVLKRPVEVRLMNWEAAQIAVRSGAADALTMLGQTPEREADFDFSQPTVPVSIALFVRADEAPSFLLGRSPGSLAGRRIGVTAGGLARAQIQTQHPEAELVLVDHLLDGTQRLLRHDIDALAAQEWSTRYLLNELGIEGIAGLEPLARRLGNIAVREGNAVLLAQIDQALATLKASGEFDRIIDRWSHTRLRQFRESTVIAMAVAAGVAALALVMLAFGVVWLQRRKRELKTEVDERGRAERALRDSQSALELADRRKDQFLAVLGHELRNPIAAVAAATQLLRRHAPQADNVRRSLDVVDRQVAHLRRLVEDLLDVRRIGAGRLAVDLGPAELQSVVRHAVELSATAIEKRRHELELDLPPTSLELRADAARLTQVLANLLNNAAKYTPPGGSIRLSARVESEALRIAVEDNGIGIDPARLDRVFDMFHQEESAQALAQGGLGIGLWLTRQLVELHAGRIEARSGGIGQGSVFIVHLPLLARVVADESAGVA